MSGLRLLLQRPHLRLIRTPLLIAGGGVLLAAAAFALAHVYAGRVESAHAQAAQALAAVQAELDGARQSQDALEASLRRYRHLRETGFIGEGDRVGWTEALADTQRALGLPALTFELQPRRALAAGAPLPEATAPMPATPGAQAHDLHFTLAGIHEGELLALIDGLRARERGHFRVEDCELRRGNGLGLDADCTLRWFTWLPPQAAAPDAPEATP